MSSHVPKFGGSNAGNSPEVVTLARGGGKAGSDDSAASSQPEESGNGPVYSGRGAASGGRGGATAPTSRRESGSSRSSQEGSLGPGNNRPSPPARRDHRDSSARTGVRGSHDKGSRSNNPPRNINEDYGGASHLPKFGEWNGGEGETNYTVMFTAASQERKTGVAVDDTPMKGSGDSYSNSSRLPKKQSSCWPCF